MNDAVYNDPTFNAAVAMEVREKRGCGVCIRRVQLMPQQFACGVNKRFPACKREFKGFVYDEGE
ncbi:MAG: hypothetical protein JKY48_15000 [Flavobacteriales bacterium]|nr:hypothetical protein [Flavobacteriales bacterium]